MNIHITDKELFNKLKDATIAKVLIGSHMYGTNNKYSDTDYLNIYATSTNELNSFVQVNHQLQYKEDEIDYNFVSLHSFIKNIINGDSSINFEVVHSNSLIGTDLEWLYEYRNVFNTYTVIRNYLGLCRRDIKYFHKCETDIEKIKKLRHIIRGYIYSRCLIDNVFDFEACNRCLLEVEINVKDKFQLRKYESLISDLRIELTEKFNNKTLGLPQHINVEFGNKLNNRLLKYCVSENFKNKQKLLKDFDMNIFINSLENWVEY